MRRNVPDLCASRTSCSIFRMASRPITSTPRCSLKIPRTRSQSASGVHARQDLQEVLEQVRHFRGRYRLELRGRRELPLANGRVESLKQVVVVETDKVQERQDPVVQRIDLRGLVGGEVLGQVLVVAAHLFDDLVPLRSLAAALLDSLRSEVLPKCLLLFREGQLHDGHLQGRRGFRALQEDLSGGQRAVDLPEEPCEGRLTVPRPGSIILGRARLSSWASSLSRRCFRRSGSSLSKSARSHPRKPVGRCTVGGVGLARPDKGRAPGRASSGEGGVAGLLADSGPDLARAEGDLGASCPRGGTSGGASRCPAFRRGSASRGLGSAPGPGPLEARPSGAVRRTVGPFRRTPSPRTTACSPSAPMARTLRPVLRPANPS